jgi:SAM-dependent MidA family methyltransferase
MTQAEFLGRLGIVERAARLMAANPALAGEIEAGVQRLISPTGMGGLFKVLVLCSSGLPPPPPFV